MNETTVKQTKKVIAIIAEYLQRASRNEQLQEAKIRLDKKMVLLSDKGMLMAAFVPAMTSYTREKFFEAIALALKAAQLASHVISKQAP
ncbi:MULTISPECIES: hypothetical protein [Enterobacteriaceae]|uniref:hypothetical protein n=1 Tax=Enterobacteriaceae TaxID=543 RepID=UPI00226BBB69|nr:MULTISPECIES: hypothetical protein [Enterobacteriaceae]MCX9043739.1 hypothetical protein [Citrobacter portucalensis]MDA8491153.1 hypothetical protein [Kluyvera sp. Awk 3]